MRCVFNENRNCRNASLLWNINNHWEMTAREGRHTGMSGSCLAQGISSLRQKCQYCFHEESERWICFPGKPGAHSSSQGVQLSPALQKITLLVHFGVLWVEPPRTRYILMGCFSTAFVSPEQSPASTGGCVLSPPTEHGHPSLCAASPNYGPQCQTYPLNSHPEICMKSRTVQAGKF